MFRNYTECNALQKSAAALHMRKGGRFWPISAGQSHPMCWSNPMQTTGQVECKWVVNCDVNGWASGMQFPIRHTVLRTHLEHSHRTQRFQHTDQCTKIFVRPGWSASNEALAVHRGIHLQKHIHRDVARSPRQS